MSASKIDPVTEEEKARWPKEPLVDLENPFVDVRGRIQPLLDEAMKSAVWIESAAGSVRANHYHKTDWHYCYVVSGEMEYFHRKTGSEDEPEKVVARTGDMVFTPPMVDHAMHFTKDTVFLTLSRNPRDQETYEADVERVEVISTEGLISWKPGDND